MALIPALITAVRNSTVIRRRIRKTALLLLALTTTLLPPLLFAVLFNGEGNLLYVWVHGILSVLLAAPPGFFFASASASASSSPYQSPYQSPSPSPYQSTDSPGAPRSMLSSSRTTPRRGWDAPSGNGYGRYVAGGLFFLLQAALVILVITIVSITSSSSYAAWFSFVSREGASSTISYYFVLKLLLFSSFTGAAIIRNNILIPLLLLSFMLLMLFSVMYAVPWLAAAAVASLVLAIFLMDIRSRGKYDRRGLLSILQYVVLCLLVAALVWVVSSRNPDPPSPSVLPDRLTGTVFRLWTDFPLAVDIPGFGGNYGTGGIDGSAALSSSPVFLLKHPGRRGDVLHLRSQVFDLYQDSSWRISGRFIQTSDNGMLGRTDIAGDPSPGDIEITTLAEYYSSVPHLLETSRIIDGGEAAELSYASTDSGFLFARPFTRGRRFLLINEGSASQGNAGRPDAAPEDPAEDPSGHPRTDPPDARDLSHYLQLSNYISQEVRDLGAELKGDSPAESIRSVRDYLRENFDYTLSYPRVAGRTDVVSHFLGTADAGYCTQFASSMTILLRTMGIPSRYVTGFYTRLSRDSDETVVRGLNAHAWSEAWIDGRGWVVVEATPPMMQGNGENDPARYNPYADRLTGRQLEGVFGRPADPPEPQVLPGSGIEEKQGISIQKLLLSAGVVLAVMLGSILGILALAGFGFMLLPVKWKIPLKLKMILRLTSLRIADARAVFEDGQDHSQDGSPASGWLHTLRLLENNSRIDAREHQMLRPLLLRFCYSARQPHRSELQALNAALGKILPRLMFDIRIRKIPQT